MYKPKAFIDNWCVHSNRLIGSVYGHPRQQEFVREQQVTSKLLELQEGTRLAETENTVYLLGRKFEG